MFTVLEELSLFENALTDKRVADASELIKFTFNDQYFCRGTGECNLNCLEPENCPSYRHAVIEDFQTIANSLNFNFDVQLKELKLQNINWYYKGKKIFPINGFIKHMPGEFSRPRRNPIPGVLRHEVFVRDGYKCLECGATNKDEKLEVDHIIPVAHGGTDELENLQTLCRVCNLAKSHRAWKSPENKDE